MGRMELIIDSPKFGRFIVIIDDEDGALVQNYSWHISASTNGKYCVKAWIRGLPYKERKGTTLSRLLLSVTDNSTIYFIDDDWTNHRKSNLKKCNPPLFIDNGDYYSIIIDSFKFGTHTIIIDREDYELAYKYAWCIAQSKEGKPLYAFARNDNGNNIRLHNLIMGNAKGCTIDHKNRNSLDNRRINLRIATASQNRCNTAIRTNNSTGYKGVYYIKSRNRFWAYIGIDGKRVGGGYHKTPEKAAEKYNEMALKYHGEFACLNIIDKK